MKKIINTLFVCTILILIVSCSNQNQYQLNKNMLPVTTKSDSAAIHYFNAWDIFHYEFDRGYRESLNKAIEYDPEFFMAYTMNALMHTYFRDTVEFENAANLALNCNIDLNDAEKVWKKILENQLTDLDADVTSIAQEFVDKYPDVPESYNLLGIYYSIIEEHEKAITNFKKAVELSEDYPVAYLHLGYALLGLERYEEAEPIFDKYLELLPDAPNAYDSKGDYYMSIGDYKSAYENFLKVQELGGNWKWNEKKTQEALEKMNEAEIEE